MECPPLSHRDGHSPHLLRLPHGRAPHNPNPLPTLLLDHPRRRPELLDAFLAPVLLIGALFFQWRIAGVIAPFTVEVLDNTFIYKHDNYWPLAFFQVVLAVAVGYGENEICRRFAAVGSVAGLWLIGWFCTPLRYKLEAWEHLKWVWTWMAFEQGTRLMGGARGGRRRY
ncbi:hypothetical protein LOCC1_G007168 [Lachnellula occidentalis]|uniref:Uncharacterized protein n=1 Tax=Lachnellula occidentalis TaxID=215460 RepID=A0A8H8RG31_9HELO|nr:hypothetical protein LOCC1_G007168 [Lachnellula occidentalis]